MRPVRIHQGKTFPLFTRLLVSGMVCALIVFIFHYIQSPISLIISILISPALSACWFATRIFEIDIANRMIFQGNWTMGFRWGSTTNYEQINLLKRKERIKRTEFSLPGNKTLFTDREYRAYLIVDSETELYLFGHPIEDRINEKMKVLRKKLSIPNLQNP